jgi:hypothetical protein
MVQWITVQWTIIIRYYNFAPLISDNRIKPQYLESSALCLLSPSMNPQPAGTSSGPKLSADHSGGLLFTHIIAPDLVVSEGVRYIDKGVLCFELTTPLS